MTRDLATSYQDPKQRIPVLTWHKVGPKMEPGLTRVSSACFQKQLEAIAQAGYKSLSAKDYLDRRGLRRPGEKECLLCFDDAYACVAEYGAPLMKTYDFTGVLFPPLAHIGRDNRWDRGLLGVRFDHMTDEALRALLKEGWSLGFHGRSHRGLHGRNLTELEDEILLAGQALEERFEQSIRLLAWPFGCSDRRSRLLAESAGFKIGLGGPRAEGKSLLDLPRHMIYPIHGRPSIQAMLAGRGPDFLQRLASRGAALSARLLS